MENVDFHVHSWRSCDSLSRPGAIIRKLEELGMHAIVVDHDSLARVVHPRVIPGEEVSTDVAHLVCFNLQEGIPPGPWQEVIDNAHGQGGRVILAHPPRGLPDELARRVDAIEVANAKSGLEHSVRSFMWARKFRKPMVGGSDAHFPGNIGSAYTVADWDALLKGRFRISDVVFGSQTSLLTRAFSALVLDLRKPEVPPRLVKRIWKRL